jgi:hypothetical protein
MLSHCAFIVAQTTGDFLADEIERQLEELGELEPAILENQAKLDTCDILCYTYDSSDPDSFSHIVELRVSLTATEP